MIVPCAPNYNGNTVDDDCLVADFKRRLIIEVGGKSARSNEGFSIPFVEWSFVMREGVGEDVSFRGKTINVLPMILVIITWNRTSGRGSRTLI